MENAADALKMAFGVLVFVLALSISILSFGEARKTADIIISYQDRENDYIYYEYDAGKKNRSVGIETIVPSLARLKVERYRVVFQFSDSRPLYTLNKRKGTTIEKEKVTSLDLTKLTAEQADKYDEFIHGIIYQPFSGDASARQAFEKKFSVTLEPECLYDRLKGKTFTEELGEYSKSGEDVPEVQKEYKRVITYTQDR